MGCHRGYQLTGSSSSHVGYHGIRLSPIISHDGSGWCCFFYANMTGVYWWDPWHTIYSSTMDPMGIVDLSCISTRNYDSLVQWLFSMQEHSIVLLNKSCMCVRNQKMCVAWHCLDTASRLYGSYRPVGLIWWVNSLNFLMLKTTWKSSAAKAAGWSLHFWWSFLLDHISTFIFFIPTYPENSQRMTPTMWYSSIFILVGGLNPSEKYQ